MPRTIVHCANCERRAWRIVAVILPLAWLGALMAVFQLSDNPHSWVLSVWGESHPAWDLLTAAAGIACACTEGNALWKGWME